MILPSVPQNTPIAGASRVTAMWFALFVAMKAALVSGTVERLSTVERDALPASATVHVGKVIYNTTTLKINFWDGVAWRVVTSV
jgi:hypothetical protein